MSKIKLVATDIDGTILRHDFTFSNKVKTCIKELTLAGIKVCLVTGRMYESARPLAVELGLNTPITGYQGALIKENCENPQILYQKTLATDKARNIIKWAKENDIHIQAYMNDELYVEEINETVSRYTGEQRIKVHVQPFDNLELNNINKLLIIDFDNADLVTRALNYVSKNHPELYVVNSTAYFCEICNKEATKGDAVRFLQKYYNLAQDEILTIGDHNNDIELLKAGGIKVAMGNATEELKSVASFVTDTVENDGFVKAIDKFIGLKSNV